MTREEEKELASEEYVKSTLVGSPYIKKLAFKGGIEWADKHPAKPQLSARDRGFIDEMIKTLEILEDEKKLYFGDEKEFLKKIRRL